MVVKVTQIAPEVILWSRKWHGQTGSEIFITGNDFCGSFNVFLMLLKDFYVIKSVKKHLLVHKNSKIWFIIPEVCWIYLRYTLMVLKVPQISPEVIFAKPEVTCFQPEVTFLWPEITFIGPEVGLVLPKVKFMAPEMT